MDPSFTVYSYSPPSPVIQPVDEIQLGAESITEDGIFHCDYVWSPSGNIYKPVIVGVVADVLDTKEWGQILKLTRPGVITPHLREQYDKVYRELGQLEMMDRFQEHRSILSERRWRQPSTSRTPSAIHIEIGPTTTTESIATITSVGQGLPAFGDAPPPLQIGAILVCDVDVCREDVRYEGTSHDAVYARNYRLKGLSAIRLYRGEARRGVQEAWQLLSRVEDSDW